MLRHPELLAKLTAEVDSCLEKQIRVPRGDWKYLDHLNPTPGEKQNEHQDAQQFDQKVISQRRNFPDRAPGNGRQGNRN